MKINKSNIFKALLVMGLSTCIYTNNAVADDDVAVLVVDNGPSASVPEPSALSLLLGGAIALTLVGRRNRKNR